MIFGRGGGYGVFVRTSACPFDSYYRLCEPLGDAKLVAWPMVFSHSPLGIDEWAHPPSSPCACIALDCIALHCKQAAAKKPHACGVIA